MNIKLDHINLTVASLEESIDWYRQVFGFKLVESGTNSYGTKWAIVALNDSMICMSESKKRAPADRYDDETFHQIYHFGIRVSDLEHWQQVVQQHQLKLYYGGVIDYPSSKSWYIHDPSGHEIEVSYAFNGRIEFPE